MRKTSTLDALFTAPRQGILVAALMQPERWWYQSDLARHLGVHHATLQRELARLTAAEILVRRKDGNRTYYRANEAATVFPELRALLTKTVGLLDVIREALRAQAEKIRVAFIYGSVASSSERSESDVDLMVIGETSLRVLTPAVRSAERKLGRAINPTVYGFDEFVQKSEKSSFLREVLAHPKLFVIGAEDDLEEVGQGRPSRRAATRTKLDRRTGSGR